MPGSREGAARWADVDRVVEDAVRSGAVPGAVALVASPGELIHAASFGVESTETGAPLRADSLLRGASQMKLPTTIATLRLLETGQLDLDTPVGDVLPEFDALQVLTGFDDAEPILRPPASRATIRQLLTHTSGLGYDFWDRRLDRYYRLTGQLPLGSGKLAAFTAPLLDDPGVRFRYGMSMDWAGRVVETIEGEPLQDVLSRLVFEPLGLRDTTCLLTDEQRPRIAPVHVETSPGRWVPTAADYYSSSDTPEFVAGGHSLYTTPLDYLRIQRLVLRGGELDGHRVLSRATVDEIFRDHLGGLTVGTIETAQPDVSFEVPLGNRRWSLGQLLNVDSEPGKRSAMSAGWAGGFNTFYWMDRAAEVAVALYTQTLPFFHPAVVALVDRFERAVYLAL